MISDNEEGVMKGGSMSAKKNFLIKSETNNGIHIWKSEWLFSILIYD